MFSERKELVYSNRDKAIKELQPIGYGADLLINGNISECIRYMSILVSLDNIKCIHAELLLINELCPDKYEYVLGKIRPLKYLRP